MKVSIEYECGEKTCAVAPGKFCRFVRVSRFGKRYSCARFFDAGGDPQGLKDSSEGWLARCKQCLEANP